MPLGWLAKLFPPQDPPPEPREGPAPAGGKQPLLATPGSELTESRTSIRDTTKWMVAGAGAVGTLVVAGLQLSALPTSMSGRVLGLSGFALAIVGVGLVLNHAANVLAIGYTNVGELSDLKLQIAESNAKAQLSSDVKPPPGVTRDQFVRSLDKETAVLSRGEATNVSDLFRKLMDSYKALSELRDGQQSSTVVTRNYTLKDLPILADRTDALESAAGQLISFSNQRLVEAYFRRLKQSVVIGGALVAIGAGMFALATTLGHPLALTQPVEVMIYPAKGTIAFGPSCAATSLSGVALGGDWEEPRVAVAPSANCAAAELTVTRDIGVVVPIIKQQGNTP